ncbi:ETHYLENE INSENSITIVE 3-like 4 protein [Carex littledalei]|uniref:ETHYLENE INSENSITIVE 3-like 4 protein n=1 Tax=Carex littledalei TaxID=544730 RepID=A0A833RBF1_9POAL|nr:ETHYLENE INSENSITIVE 3-like 4 protein [Carex littledalei]
MKCTNPFQCPLQKHPRSSNQKTLQRAEDGVLRCMLKLMRDSNAQGFVYGILPKTGPPITGSSDSMRAWWKDTVAFDRNAPPSLVMNPEAILPVVEQTLVSYLYKLQDMNDNTIGSILSALIQHCEPPQRNFPFDQKMVPLWWPTGKETWWGLQGKPQAELCPPPYRKTHDLRKGWKLSLLAAVIKHMSPRFDHVRTLVWQSKRLQCKMSAKDVDTWSRVLNQEEALVEHSKKSLVIAPSGDDTTDTRSMRRRLENSRENCSENGDCWEGELMQDVDIEMNSIDELMRLYQQENSNADWSTSF